MRITLVAKRNGRRVVCWGSWLKLMLGTASLGAALATLAYVLLAQRWNPLAPLAGLGAGVAAAIVCLLANLFTPMPRLPTLGN